MKKNLKKAVVLFSAICMISTSTEYFLLVNRSYSASAEEINNSIEYLGESGQYKASSNSKEISVSTYEDLKEAIDNKDISTIFITEDIEFEDTIDIKRSLNIVGKDGKKELLFKYKEDHTSYGLENLFFIIDEKDESENEITVKLNNLKVKGEYREEIVDRSSGNGGISSGGSGGIVSKGNIEIKDCIFSENIGKFGALYGFKEILLEGDNLFENNRSISEGGAICGGPSILDESYNSISNYTESDDEWNNLQLETSKNNKSSLIIKGDTSFVYNTALGHGGAISNTRVKISKESNVIFKENSSWIGGGAIADSISNHAENREDLKNIDIEGSALFENNTSYIGGAIFGSGIKTGERADVRFVNNISELLGGSMYVASDRIVDLSNKEGVLFKIDNKISEAMENSIITKSHGIEAFYGKYKHGLFIATSGKTNNIKNSSFVNESDNIATKEASLIAFTGGNYEKDSMIFDDNYVFSNEIKDNISFMQVLSPLDEVNIKKNYIKGFNNMIEIGCKCTTCTGERSDYKNLSKNEEKTLKHRKESILNSIDLKKAKENIESDSIPNITFVNSNVIKETGTLNLVKNNIPVKINMDIDFYNNTVGVNKFELDSNYDSRKNYNIEHNLFNFNNMKNKFNPGYNNIYIGNMENEALNSLGEAKKAKNGSFEESNEKILFEKKNSPLLKDRKESLSQNVYMNEKNESDIKDSLNQEDLTICNVGKGKDSTSIKHKDPILKSYVCGFKRVTSISHDAIGIERGDMVTMGPIEAQRDYLPEEVCPPDEKPGGGGGGSETKNYVILASGDKYTDVLTATVLANEKKCPILLTDKNKVSDNTLKEIDRLNADKIIISGGPQSVSEKVVEQLENEGHDVRRIAGQNRYETARKIGQEVRLTTKNMDEAVLVDGTNFPDVITMSTLANEKRVPILLTEPKSLNKITQDTLKDWSIDELTIGGEELSVSKGVENKIREKVRIVDRIGGQNRYKTSYLIAKELKNSINNKNIILVDGTDFPDGITISSLAAKFKSPILLTTPNNIHPTTAKAINDWTIENILIGGGYNSVSKSIEDKLDIKNKERVAGSNRYNTAVEISKRYTESTELGKR